MDVLLHPDLLRETYRVLGVPLAKTKGVVQLVFFLVKCVNMPLPQFWKAAEWGRLLRPTGVSAEAWASLWAEHVKPRVQGKLLKTRLEVMQASVAQSLDGCLGRLPLTDRSAVKAAFRTLSKSGLNASAMLTAKYAFVESRVSEPAPCCGWQEYWTGACVPLLRKSWDYRAKWHSCSRTPLGRRSK